MKIKCFFQILYFIINRKKNIRYCYRSKDELHETKIEQGKHCVYAQIGKKTCIYTLDGHIKPRIYHLCCNLCPNKECKIDATGGGIQLSPVKYLCERMFLIYEIKRRKR